jgi:putative transposase
VIQLKERQYTKEQIIAVLEEGGAGAKMADLSRKHGMSDATYYNWKSKYLGMTVSDLELKPSSLPLPEPTLPAKQIPYCLSKVHCPRVEANT